MASLLGIGLCYMKRCSGVCLQNSIVNSVRADEWTTELTIIASNDTINLLYLWINSS